VPTDISYKYSCRKSTATAISPNGLVWTNHWPIRYRAGGGNGLCYSSDFMKATKLKKSFANILIWATGTALSAFKNEGGLPCENHWQILVNWLVWRRVFYWPFIFFRATGNALSGKFCREFYGWFFEMDILSKQRQAQSTTKKSQSVWAKCARSYIVAQL